MGFVLSRDRNGDTPAAGALARGIVSTKVVPTPGILSRNQIAGHAAREIARDREPQPHTLLAHAREVAIDLHEGLEDLLELVLRDAAPACREP